MTPRQARTAILQSFLTHWNAYSFTGATPPVVYDNTNLRTDGGEYVHLNVSHSGGTVAALGNELYRRNGSIIANIFVPEGNGQARVDEIAEAVLAWLEGFAVAGVRLRDPGYNEIGSFGGYWQANAAATFEYDALRT